MSYYSDHSQEYIAATIESDMKEAYAMFEPFLPKGGKVLDVGFGSGRDMLHFQNQGYEVKGIDLEPSFVDHAKSLGLDAQIGDVRTYEPNETFDGIWACASLLHLKRSELQETMERLLTFLKPSGVLFVSMKEGEGEGFDSLNRRMLYVSTKDFASFRVVKLQKTIEPLRGIVWINVVIQRNE